jgi:hypothetical protein
MDKPKRTCKSNVTYSNLALGEYTRLILEGEREISASRLLKINHPELSHRQIALIKKKALNNLKILRNVNAKELIDLHLLRYEEIYRAALSFGFTSLAVKALNEKERILNLHEQQETSITFSKKEINITQSSDFDFSKLPDKKQDRIKVLLDKSRSEMDRHNQYLVNRESAKLRQELKQRAI